MKRWRRAVSRTWVCCLPRRVKRKPRATRPEGRAWSITQRGLKETLLSPCIQYRIRFNAVDSLPRTSRSPQPLSMNQCLKGTPPTAREMPSRLRRNYPTEHLQQPARKPRRYQSLRDQHTRDAPSSHIRWACMRSLRRSMASPEQRWTRKRTRSPASPTSNETRSTRRFVPASYEHYDMKLMRPRSSHSSTSTTINT